MIKNLTRGGQTFLHTYQMVKHIAYVLIVWFIVIFIVCNVAWIYYKTNSYDYYVIIKLIEANCRIFYGRIYAYLGIYSLVNSGQEMDYINFYGIHSSISASYLLNQLTTLDFISRIKAIFYKGVINGLWISLIAIFMIGLLLDKRGKKLEVEKHVRGAMLSEADELKKQILSTEKVSDITIADIPIPKNSETQHILITGTTGAGKTVCMVELLSQIRHKKQRTIVYDHTGAYTEYFYRPEKDILLNPLDERSPVWNVWAECKIDAHYDSMAESLIPMPTTGQDPFWVMAARIMFAVAARRLKQYGETSTPRLLRYLLMADLNRIQELITNTEAEALASEKAEKMALSVKAVLSTYLRSMRYLPDGPNVFSIRDWVANEKDDSWIFITSREDQHATLKPLISTYLDIAANAILSLTKDRNRRIFLSIDEADSLQYVPSILQFLTKSRKYGGCGILGLQAISQFYKNYGEEDAETIISCCNTGIHFRSRGKKTAAYVAELLGDIETKEMTENISFGAAGVKDGVSVNQQKSVKQLVLASQIKQLNDLEAYLQLKGNWPITKTSFKYVPYSELQPDFIPRKIIMDDTLEKAIKQIRTEAKKQNVLISGEKSVPSKEKVSMKDAQSSTLTIDQTSPGKPKKNASVLEF